VTGAWGRRAVSLRRGRCLIRLTRERDAAREALEAAPAGARENGELANGKRAGGDGDEAEAPAKRVRARA
jgi:hypothetical protein